MRKVAWYLKADSERGKAGDVVGGGSLRDPFQISVSSPAGVVDRLTVTGAQFNHVFAWSEIALPGGHVAVVAVQSPDIPNFLFVKNSTLDVQRVVRLAEPVTLAAPLTDALCVVTDRQAPEVEGAVEACVEIVPEDEGKLKDPLREGSSKNRWRVQGNRVVENADTRVLLRVHVGGDSGTVATTVQAAAVDVTFEAVDAEGRRLKNYEDPDFIVQIAEDHWASVPITAGLGILSLSRAEYGSYRFASNEKYVVTLPLHLIVASV